MFFSLSYNIKLVVSYTFVCCEILLRGYQAQFSLDDISKVIRPEILTNVSDVGW